MYTIILVQGNTTHHGIWDFAKRERERMGGVWEFGVLEGYEEVCLEFGVRLF